MMMTKKLLLAGLLAGLCCGPLKAEETILFLGDSITQAGHYVRMIETALKEEQGEEAPTIINKGKSSETVSGLSEAYHPGVRPNLFNRLDTILEETKPDWVVACYGINCGIYHPFDDERFDAYKKGIQRLIKKVHADGAKLILLTSPPYAKSGPVLPEDASPEEKKKLLKAANDKANETAKKDSRAYGYRTPYIYYDVVMQTYADWLLSLDDEENVWVVDLRTPMLPRLSDTHGKDPIHPNKTGHGIMAATFLETWKKIKGQSTE